MVGPAAKACLAWTIRLKAPKDSNGDRALRRDILRGWNSSSAGLCSVTAQQTLIATHRMVASISRPRDTGFKPLLHHPVHDFRDENVFSKTLFLEEFQSAESWAGISCSESQY
jgi:hypothetical protein